MPIPSANSKKDVSPYPKLIELIKSEIRKGQEAIQQIRAVTYWNIGGYIDRHFLKQKDKSGYGERLYARLSGYLQLDERTLQQMVKFYRAFPIPSARSGLKWTHYRELLRIPDKGIRAKLFTKANRRHWKTRRLREEIKQLKTQKPALQAPAQLPGATPGRLGTYRLNTPAIVALQPGCRAVDCGFGFWREVPAEGLDALKDGTIVESRVHESRFMLVESTRTEDDLNTYRAALDYVIDGDTVVMQVDLGFRSWSRQKLRLRGIDTPELSTPEGQEAKAFVERHLKRARTMTIKTTHKDKYGRYLADIFFGENQSFLNQKLLDEQLAVVYTK